MIKKLVDKDGDLGRIFSSLVHFLLLGLTLRLMASYSATGSGMGLLEIPTTAGALYFWGLLIFSFVVLNALCNIASGPKTQH